MSFTKDCRSRAIKPGRGKPEDESYTMRKLLSIAIMIVFSLYDPFPEFHFPPLLRYAKKPPNH
jgi:hypothetical protein